MKKTEKRKKRSLTLIEMIVVMLLIATITGALAFNYRASLDEGRAFKTREGISRITTILNLALAENPNLRAHDIGSEGTWEKCVQSSPLAGKGEDMIKDGWGEKYQVTVVEEDGSQTFKVDSRKLQTFEANKRK